MPWALPDGQGFRSWRRAERAVWVGAGGVFGLEVGVGREARLAPGKPGVLGGAPILLHRAGANRGRSWGHSCLVLGSLYMALEWS